MKIILSGACGNMGRMVISCCANNSDMDIIAGIDVNTCDMAFPVYSSFDDINVKADVIIDFSHVSVLEKLLEYAVKTKTPVVLATTGYSKEQIERIHDAASIIPIFFSANMSLGVNLICSLAKKAAAILGDGFNVEIIEKHHNQKIDAPSGTALMLANAVNSVFDDKYNYEFDRHSKREKRPVNEIGIHSIRGGTIVGEHDVLFAGNDEVITISHHAASKQVFANGAIKAAQFIVNQENGIFDMNDIVILD